MVCAIVYVTFHMLHKCRPNHSFYDEIIDSPAVVNISTLPSSLSGDITYELQRFLGYEVLKWRLL